MAAEADGILLDANLLLWAHHAQFPQHAVALAWWRETMSTTPLVAIPWATVLAFLRISTHPSALTRPITMDQAPMLPSRASPFNDRSFSAR